MIRTRHIASLAVAGLILASTALADEAGEQQIEVDRAKVTLESFAGSPQGASLKEVMKDAKGVLIVPQLLRAGFIWGGSGGSGVLVARNEDGTWSQPAFYGMGDVTFGLQIGGESAEVVFVLRTQKAVEALLSTEVKLGAGVSVAVVTEGAGAASNLKADMIAFSRSQGLYGGLTVKGSVIKPRNKWNEAYYGQPATATDILVRQEVSNTGSLGLREAVRRVATPATAEAAPAAE